MTAQLRHRCRNLHCRLKLPAPVENEHRAFCCRTCHERFYRTRCRVCEADLRKTGKRGDAQRLYCRAPSRCAAEAQKWPEKYGFSAQSVPNPLFTVSDSRSAHSTGLKIGIAGDRPTALRLRGCRWGGDGASDCSLYGADGLTIARIVLEPDGRHHLHAPNSIPRQSWPDLDAAKRGAEIVALMVMPVESRVAARIKRENELPHPMGSPVNRSLAIGGAISSDWRPTGDGAGVPDIPDFLLRNSTASAAMAIAKSTARQVTGHASLAEECTHIRGFLASNQGGARHLTPQEDGRPE
jgi:hypothetical protein